MPAVIFTFGRFQPPTSGHKRLLENLLEVAQQKQEETGENVYAKVFVSKKKNDMTKIIKSKAFLAMKEKKKLEPLDILENPLSSDSKLTILRQQYAGTPLEFDAETSFFTVIARLKGEGYTDITLLVGKKRAEELKKQLEKYHPDVEVLGLPRLENMSNAEKRANIPINANNTVEHTLSMSEIEEVVLEDEDLAGGAMSASKLRKAAIRATPKDIQFFLQHVAFGTYSREEALGLINEIRVGMGYRPLKFTAGGGKSTRKYKKKNKKTPLTRRLKKINTI